MRRTLAMAVAAGVTLLVVAAPASAARTEQARKIEAASLAFRSAAKPAIGAARRDAGSLRASAARCVPDLLRFIGRGPDAGDVVFEAEYLLQTQGDRRLAIRLARALRTFADALGGLETGDEPILDAAIASWRKAAADLETVARTPVPAFCQTVAVWRRNGVGGVSIPPEATALRVRLAEAPLVFRRAMRRLFQLGVKGKAARMWSSHTLVDPLYEALEWATPPSLANADVD